MIDNFKDFINEGRYDQSILKICREFINDFKKSITTKLKTFYIKYSTQYEHNEDNSIEITIIAKPSTKIDYPFDIIANTQLEKIKIGITYNPKYFPTAFSELIPQLKNTLRHELTHIKQLSIEHDDLVNKPETFHSTSTDIYYDDTILDKYLFHPDEIEAFVNGFYKESKTKRQSFIKTIDKWLDDNGKYFEDKSNLTKIKNIWIDDFTRRYSNKYLK